MKTAIFCLVFLACTSICFSTPILDCRCFGYHKNVRVKRIADVEVLEPNPYCSKKEVIVKLTTGGSLCLNPSSEFTKLVLKVIQMSAFGKKNTAGQTATPASSTEKPTASY
ncbi:permeability factor 2 [Labrus bergylta]|uniref:permeability factor 2 n=1 Tax=Labrus bergylta TaxID=56723 RepID=UPI0009B37C0B|nr:permeability factor 2-like [Labrus bergylta]